MKNYPDKVISRETLIKSYIDGEVLKKNKPIPPGYNSLNWDDPNDLDNWLEKYCYKPWIISGFKRWEYVQLSKSDLLDSAIVDHIFEGESQRLGDLIGTEKFKKWNPYQDPKPIWYKPLSRGMFEERFAVIIRAACSDEKKKWKAKFYIEDGSGRSICYLRSILNLNKESEMTGYIGVDPDPKSRALQEKFNREFSANNFQSYATFDKLIEHICKKEL